MTDMANPLQIFDALPKATEDALRASIERFGVLVPVVKDQDGRVIDGHHRSRIGDQLGVTYRVDVVEVADDAEAREVARTLNADRRQLTEEQRREVVAMLAAQTVAVGREEVARHSPNAIAGALGVSRDTVQHDLDQLADVGKLIRPEKTLGLDNKVRPTRRPAEPAEPKASKPAAVKKSPANRRPLPVFAKDTGWALRREAERIERIGADDRLTTNKAQVAAHLRGHLTYTIQVCQDLLDRLNQTQGE